MLWVSPRFRLWSVLLQKTCSQMFSVYFAGRFSSGAMLPGSWSAHVVHSLQLLFLNLPERLFPLLWPLGLGELFRGLGRSRLRSRLILPFLSPVLFLISHTDATSKAQESPREHELVESQLWQRSCLEVSLCMKDVDMYCRSREATCPTLVFF